MDQDNRDQRIRDVMTSDPCCIDAEASVMEAARVMCEQGIGDVVVLDRDQICGILTDRDIVVRALAQGSDPEETTAGDICSRELTTIAADASVSEVVQMMRDKTIRRIPVVEGNGRVVGIVSLGDLALERDRRSVLGEISAAPPNA